MADDGCALLIGPGIEHGEEVRGQLAAGVFYGEIFLVVAHHRDQNFFRQFQIFGLEAAENDGGPLRKVHNRFHQRLVFAPARAGNGACGRIQRLADELPPFGYAHHHACRAECIGIALRRE